MIGRRLRHFAAIWRLGLAEAVAYRGALFVWILNSSFPLIALALWAGLARAGPIGDYDRPGFVAYFVAAFLVRQLTASWVVWDLERQVVTGELSTLLLRPVHPILHHLMTNLAALPVRALIAAPVAAIVLVLALGDAGLELARGGALALAIPAIIGGFLLNFVVQLTIGCLAFWFTRSSALFELWLALFIALSGYAVPTSLFPGGLAELVRFLPFHAGLGFPVELLLGRLDAAAAARGFLIQWTWLLGLSVTAGLAWRRGARHFSAVGA
ncbi:MAG: ABC-2 family transporter protein [Nannocystaceae bacterium]|nr:ABC-2 family transporter protein [Myxococcales bacterium]